MGVVRAEEFISAVSLSGSDYTKWHQKIAKDMTPERFADIVEKSEKRIPTVARRK